MVILLARFRPFSVRYGDGRAASDTLLAGKRNFRSKQSKIAAAFSASQCAGDAEPIIRVLKLRRNAGPRRHARHLNTMAPGAAPRSLARAALRPLRISIRRARVVAVVIPVGAPFMDVVAHVA